MGVVELVHAGSDFADGVWEGWLFDGEILMGVDDSDDRFGVALDVEHNWVVENVLVCESLLRVQSVDHFLLLFPILLYRDRAFDFILPPNHCVVFAVVYLEFLSGRWWGDWSEVVGGSGGGEGEAGVLGEFEAVDFGGGFGGGGDD